MIFEIKLETLTGHAKEGKCGEILKEAGETVFCWRNPFTNRNREGCRGCTG